ncbi:MAG: hypothetical protein NTZ36_00670 [Candidatus Jorgensenbacteria bacterium]|nr:hypothetical protein [Candidatus Jorgensenbacteria bacterium]
MQKRTIISLGILLTGIVSMVWLFSGEKTKAGNFDISISAGGTDDARFVGVGGGTGDYSNSQNRTEDVAKEYGLEMLKINPQGIGNVTGVALPNDAVLNGIVNRAASAKILVKLFTKTDFKIVSDSSSSTIKNYIGSLVDEENKAAAATALFYKVLGSFVTESDSQKLISINNDISIHINELLAMQVPESWATFHLGLLNFWESKLTYSKSFLNKGSDPLLAASASQNLLLLLDQEKSIRTDFLSRVSGIKL